MNPAQSSPASATSDESLSRSEATPAHGAPASAGHATDQAAGSPQDERRDLSDIERIEQEEETYKGRYGALKGRYDSVAHELNLSRQEMNDLRSQVESMRMSPQDVARGEQYAAPEDPELRMLREEARQLADEARRLMGNQNDPHRTDKVYEQIVLKNREIAQREAQRAAQDAIVQQQLNQRRYNAAEYECVQELAAAGLGPEFLEEVKREMRYLDGDYPGWDSRRTQSDCTRELVARVADRVTAYRTPSPDLEEAKTKHKRAASGIGDGARSGGPRRPADEKAEPVSMTDQIKQFQTADRVKEGAVRWQSVQPFAQHRR